MNSPRDTDADGSPSNCCAFFISAVHDLSLDENHTPSSAAQQKFIIPHLQHFHLSLSKCFFLGPLLPPCHSSSCTVFFSIRVFASLCFCSESPPPRFVSMAGSVFSADEPLVSSGLAGRQQKWLWDWGDGSLVVTDTELHWWAFNCKGQTEGRKIKPQNKRLQNPPDNYTE